MKTFKRHITNLERMSLAILKCGFIAVTGILLYIDSYIIESRVDGVFNFLLTQKMLQSAALSLTLTVVGALLFDLCRKKAGRRE